MTRLRVLVLSTCLLFLLPGVASAGSAISYSPASPTTSTGVAFTVTTGGGNRDFTSIQVACVDGSGTTIYATTLTVTVPPKGTGTSKTIHPPVSTCTANVVKLNQIGSARVLATTGPFTVAPGL